MSQGRRYHGVSVAEIDVNRRSHPRLLGPFPGTWSAGKGRKRPCQIADLSLGGCFVRCQETAREGAAVSVALALDGEETISVAGTVVGEEWGHGFHVKFGPRTSVDVKVLDAVMTALRKHKRQSIK